jgi:hypothetical protein
LCDSFRARRKAAFKFPAALARVFLTIATAAVMPVMTAPMTFALAFVLVAFTLALGVMPAMPVAMTITPAIAMAFTTFTHFFISFGIDFVSRTDTPEVCWQKKVLVVSFQRTNSTH